MGKRGVRIVAGTAAGLVVTGVVVGSLAMVGSSAPLHRNGTAPRVASDTGTAGVPDPATRPASGSTTTTQAPPSTTDPPAPAPTTTTTQPTPAIGAPAHGVCPSGFCYSGTTTTTTTTTTAAASP